MANWGEKIEGGWFDSDKHLYRDEQGRIVLSTTQVFAVLGCEDFSAISPDVLEWKRTFGTAFHRAVELLVQKDLDWDSVSEVLIDPLVGIEAFLSNIGFEYEAAEEKKIHNLCGMQYGLTIDLRGRVNHRGMMRHGIIDIKTGTKFSPTWAWQLGGYAAAQPKVEKGWLGIIAQVDKLGKVTPHYIDLIKAQREFQILLSAAILKLNNNLYPIGG